MGQLGRRAGDAVVVRRQNPLRLDDLNQPEPDVAFRRLGRTLIIQDARIKSTAWKGRQAHVLFDGVPQPLVVGRAAATRLRSLLKPRAGG